VKKTRIPERVAARESHHGLDRFTILASRVHTRDAESVLVFSRERESKAAAEVRGVEGADCGSAMVMVIVATKTKREETRIMNFMLVLELEFVCLLWGEAGTRLE
jgi:hypothetical protein